MYVLKDKVLRVEIIWLHHDVSVAGHKEKWKMMELVTRNYWWPEVIRDVDIYEWMKNRIEVPVEKLKLSEVLEKPWIHLVVDFIAKLLLVAGKDAIIVVCDRLSKITYFVVIKEGTSAEELARLFRDNMWKLHRLLESVILNRRPHFVAELTKEFNRILGIKTKLLIFYPWTDG